jgi:murein L,D-transpeptidase YafK
MCAAALLAILLSGSAAAEEVDVTRAACPPSGNVIAVFTLKRELWMCREGVETARIRIALGRGGNGKQRSGDHRTPVGSYGLGLPRPSTLYGIFIPVDYPTPEQARRGHTGQALGIHGPPRGQSEPDYPTTAVDWTHGCVATGTDGDVEAVAAFVRRYRPTLLVR